MVIGKNTNYLEKLVWIYYNSECNKRRLCLYHLNPLFTGFNLHMVHLLKLFIQLLPQQQNVSRIQNLLKIDKSIITKGRGQWGKVIKNFYFKQYYDIILGEDSSVFEVDESYFKRKYNVGRLIKRKQQQLNKETINLIIQQFVSKKTTMIETESWRGCTDLKRLGYHHEKVNHQKNFVVPKKQQPKQQKYKSHQKKRNYKKYRGHTIHTQDIENKWLQSTQELKRLETKLSLQLLQQYLQDNHSSIPQILSQMEAMPDNQSESDDD